MSEVIYSKKQINPLIEKFGIVVESDKTFNEIIRMFDGQTPYQVWAIKAVFSGVCPLSVIVSIKEWADNNQQEIKNLIKGNITSYTKKDEFVRLMDEMNGLSRISLVKQTISKFNTHQRELLKDASLKGINNGIDALASATFNKWYTLFSQVEGLHKNHKDRLISTSSSLHNLSELEGIIHRALEESYVWEKNDFLGYIARNAKDCDVVYDNENIVIISVPSFESSSKICGGGRTGWCLTKQESYFKSYVKEYSDATQYFYFDFALPERDDLAHIGFTVRQGKGITNAHSTSNGDMRGSGIMYNGHRMNIDQVLKNKKIDKNIFMRLRALKMFKWEIGSLIDAINEINKNFKDSISIVYENNKRLILKFNSRHYSPLLQHTYMNLDHLRSSNGDSYGYAIFDFNLDNNSDKSVIGVRIEKDKYGVESPSYVMDAFGGKIQDYLSFFKEKGIKVSDFVNQSVIDPNLLLHKYIDEGCEAEAIELISKGGVDVNFLFENKYPIHKVLDTNMTNLFKCMVSNKNFDSTVVDHMDEPLLLSMLYMYKSMKMSNKANIKNLKEMIEFVLSLEDFNFNVKDTNYDSAINVAAEYPYLAFALTKLVDNPKVNVNIVNDLQCTSLGNAIRRNNVDAIKILGKRKDLVVRDEDIENAKKVGIKLSDYITPEAMTNGSEGLELCELTSVLADLFAQAFNIKK
ncbi:MAG: hypothetical protein IKT40_12005 [Bacilli bacterium]|nr:hypothetical protein [Bacilli bacterium]